MTHTVTIQEIVIRPPVLSTPISSNTAALSPMTGNLFTNLCITKMWPK